MKASEVFSHWGSVRRGLMDTLDKFSDEELDYAPFEGSWNVRQITLHIAGAEEGWLRYIATNELDEWPSFRASDYPTIASIVSRLTEIHGRTETYLEKLEAEDLERPIKAPWDETLSLRWIIWHVLEHEIHHRAELSLILGLLGREGLDP